MTLLAFKWSKKSRLDFLRPCQNRARQPEMEQAVFSRQESFA